jgi:hypothetical protein
VIFLVLLLAGAALYWSLCPLAGAERTVEPPAEGDLRAGRRAAALREILEDLAMGKITPDEADRERERLG